MKKTFSELRQHTWWIAVVVALFVLSTSCAKQDSLPDSTHQAQQQQQGQPPITLAPDEVILTLLSTNDIHGGVEPFVNAKGEKFGGLARISGVFRSIREGMQRKYRGSVGFLQLDGGDQFQGTLLSNFDEGKLTIDAMGAMGYDAVVPGNHDYDFGPLGWLQDKVIPGEGDQDPRGAFKRLVAAAKFPFLSSNTFYKSSIRDARGELIEVDGDSCRPLNPSQVSTPANLPVIDWSQARRPDWVTPYIIREVAGARVAVIGVDLHETPTVTTPQNVTDLCFDTQADAYLRLRDQLEGQADVFVAVMHDGSDSAKGFLQKIVDSRRPHALDAVIAGHTHRPEDFRIGGIPMIQAGANAERFGRIDLVYDLKQKRVVPEKTRSFGGVQVPLQGCTQENVGRELCATNADGAALYEGIPLTPDPAVQALIDQARAAIAPVAGRKLGTATDVVKRDYLAESPLANALTDVMREISGAEVAFMNGGGIRADLPKGDIDYETFFRVLPFGNRGVVIAPMKMEQLLGLLTMAAQTCGIRGGLMASGLRVKFEQDCTDPDVKPAGGLDAKARLLHVEMASGEVILDVEKGIQPDPNRTFMIATLDFLHSGGSGYSYFVGTPLVKDLGILREVMVEAFLKKPFVFEAKTDGRWVGVKRPPAPKLPTLNIYADEAAFVRDVRAALAAEAHRADPCGLE